MAECAYCKTETELYEGNVPVCIRCADEPQKTRNLKAALLKALEEANERADDASDVFLAITGEVPSGLPHADGTQRIHSASHELNVAREALMKAHNRLNDFLI